MFSITYGAHHNKLKAHLRLAVSRLKTVEKKKTEANNKARAEIAQLLAGKRLFDYATNIKKINRTEPESALSILSVRII